MGRIKLLKLKRRFGKMYKKIFVGIILISLIFLACPAFATEFYTITTATTGGSYYPAGVAITQLWNEQLGKKLDIKFSAQSSAGSVENADILRKKEAEIAIMQNNVVLWSYFGTHIFKDKPNKNFRLLQPFVPNAYHFIVANNINSLLDIKGKRFVVGRAGSGSATASQAVLEALGISYDEFKPESLGQGEGLNAVRNGVVDGILALGGYPVPAIADVMAAPKRSYKILNLTDVERKIINKVENWILPTEIPANTYLNQPEPIKTLQHVALFIVTEEMPEEVAYELAKTSWEKMDWLRKASAIFNRMKIENVDEDFINYPVPLHKGAEKYYKEIGIIK